MPPGARCYAPRHGGPYAVRASRRACPFTEGLLTIATKRSRPRRPKRGGGASKPKSLPAELHPTTNPPEVDSFREWDLHPDVLDTITRGMNIEKPTPIQALSIGAVLEGRDVIAKAETGTGKTLAFGAPLMSKVEPDRATVLALVLCPTRELAQQVAVVLAELGKPRQLKVALIVGGEPMVEQVVALRGGAQVVVGTPGRVLDMYERKFLSFPWCEFAILDEADMMLEIGFLEDVEKILSKIPKERQTLLFSATFPPEVLRLAREQTIDPIEVATASGASAADTIDQVWVPVERGRAHRTLMRLIETSGPDDVFIVFCERRTDVTKLMRPLVALPYTVQALHGGYEQSVRFRIMNDFREKKIKVLVATDVASRGLDIRHVTHVVNLNVPGDVTDYTHRIGRTGRAGRAGCAITLVDPEDERRWKMLERQMNWTVERADLERIFPSRRADPVDKPTQTAPPSDRDDAADVIWGEEDARPARTAQPERARHEVARTQRSHPTPMEHKRANDSRRSGQGRRTEEGSREQTSTGSRGNERTKESAQRTAKPSRDDRARSSRTSSKAEPVAEPSPKKRETREAPPRAKQATSKTAKKKRISKPSPGHGKNMPAATPRDAIQALLKAQAERRAGNAGKPQEQPSEEPAPTPKKRSRRRRKRS